MGRGRRAFKNTIYMYARTGMQMIVSLYAVRILLQNLGLYDYGIYNTIGSLVVLSSFITSAMSSSTQRYVSYALGEGNETKLAKTINIAKRLHFVLGIIVVLLCESIGLIFINQYMNIVPDRRPEVFVVLQFSILAFFLNVVLVPFRSVLIAYERFDVISIATVLESVEKLIIAWLIGQWFIYSQLVSYAFLFVVITAISFYIHYYYYCIYKINILSKDVEDKNLMRGMLSFSGWNFLGGIGQVLVNQLSNMFLNVFYGPTVNAAQGVATQVNGVVMRFVGDFMSAINPQITKSFSAHDYNYLNKITYSSIKMSYYLMLALAVPLAFNIEFVLSRWLHEVPQYVPAFIKLLMVNSCILSLTGSISFIVESNGKIKYTQICYTIVMVLTTITSYVLLKAHSTPNVVYYMMIVSTIGSMVIRLYFARRYKLIKISEYFGMMLRSILPLTISYSVIYYVLFSSCLYELSALQKFLLSLIVTIIFLPLYGYYIYLSKFEKAFIRTMIHKKKNG